MSSYSYCVVAVQAVSPSMTDLHSFVLKHKIISAFYSQWKSNKNMGMHSEFVSDVQLFVHLLLMQESLWVLNSHKWETLSNMNLSTDMNNASSIIIWGNSINNKVAQKNCETSQRKNLASHNHLSLVYLQCRCFMTHGEYMNCRRWWESCLKKVVSIQKVLIEYM